MADFSLTSKAIKHVAIYLKVINVERKWYRIIDGQFTRLNNDQRTEPKFDRLIIKSVQEGDKGI